MAAALDEQQAMPPTQSLSFEERLALLADRERLYRDNTRRTRLVRQAHLKVAQACLENLDYMAARGLDKRRIASPASCDWVRRGQNVLITGPTGSGKTWLACALAQHACREGRSALYWRVPRLFEELRVAHGDGSYMRLLKRIEKASILVLDDWGLTAQGSQDRADQIEILDDRVHARSTILISQMPVDTWHAYLGEPTRADAILDRFPLAMQGDSIRKQARSLPRIQKGASAACGGRPTCGSDITKTGNGNPCHLDR
jgi:DNA replication protein DnaC